MLLKCLAWPQALPKSSVCITSFLLRWSLGREWRGMLGPGRGLVGPPLALPPSQASGACYGLVPQILMCETVQES